MKSLCAGDRRRPCMTRLKAHTKGYIQEKLYSSDRSLQPDDTTRSLLERHLTLRFGVWSVIGGDGVDRWFQKPIRPDFLVREMARGIGGVATPC